jgi:hypothetical protein
MKSFKKQGLGVSILFVINLLSISSFGDTQKGVCFKNEFASKKCYEESLDWQPYCSIDTMCVDQDENKKFWVVVKHVNGKKVNYPVTSWTEEETWQQQRRSILQIGSVSPDVVTQGKMWISYDYESQTKMSYFIAYTPEDFHFQGGVEAEE